ncbi:MAG: NAAT family transporter [bacterium]
MGTDSELGFFLTAFISLFALIDPIGVVPLFVSITPSSTAAKRRSMARRACWFVFLVLSFFAVTGSTIFRFLGTTIGAFRIAGGLILLKISLEMIEARVSPSRHTSREDEEGRQKDDVAILPLGIPLLAGPGSISGVIVLMSRTDGWTMQLLVFAAIALNALLAYFLLRYATRISGLLRETGQGVLMRIMGLLLAAISMEFILSGIREYFQP